MSKITTVKDFPVSYMWTFTYLFSLFYPDMYHVSYFLQEPWIDHVGTR